MDSEIILVYTEKSTFVLLNQPLWNVHTRKINVTKQRPTRVQKSITKVLIEYIDEIDSIWFLVVFITIENEHNNQAESRRKSGSECRREQKQQQHYTKETERRHQ